MAQVQERDDRLARELYEAADETGNDDARERQYRAIDAALEAWAPTALERERARAEAAI